MVYLDRSMCFDPTLETSSHFQVNDKLITGLCPTARRLGPMDESIDIHYGTPVYLTSYIPTGKRERLWPEV
jgi:hypothetical protein